MMIFGTNSAFREDSTRSRSMLLLEFCTNIYRNIDYCIWNINDVYEISRFRRERNSIDDAM